MTAIDPEDIRYPIGQFQIPPVYSSDQRNAAIHSLIVFPEKLRNETVHLTEEQINIPYRVGGWNIRQVVHHCADSHMNAFIRFKLALTETEPIIKPYEEALWAELHDNEMPLEYSLRLIEGLHARWAYLLQAMEDADFDKTLYHPEKARLLSLNEMLALYDWHCRHHLAHIIGLKSRMGWK